MGGLEPGPERFAMTCSRTLLALTFIMGISRGGIGGQPAIAFAQEKSDAKVGTSPPHVSGDRRLIQGKTVDEWLAALKDRDPAVRERAVEVLGERSLDPAVPAR